MVCQYLTRMNQIQRVKPYGICTVCDRDVPLDSLRDSHVETISHKIERGGTIVNIEGTIKIDVNQQMCLLCLGLTVQSILKSGFNKDRIRINST